MPRKQGSWTRAIAVGLLSGTVNLAIQIILGQSVSTSMASALPFSLFMAIAVRWGMLQSSHLSELTGRQQRAVTAAVRRGRPVTDPELATPVIRHAQFIQESVPSPAWAKVLLWILVSLSVVALIVAAGTRDAYVAIAGAFSLAVWLLVLVVGPAVDRRRTAHAQAAEAAALPLVARRCDD